MDNTTNNNIKKHQITIVTINGYSNYGNRLQLFALSRVLKMQGYSVHVYIPNAIYDKAKKLIKYKTIIKYIYLKQSRLYIFTQKHISKTLNDNNSQIEIYGSDQIWNPNYIKTSPYLLNTRSKAFKISYAASIGKSELSNHEKRMFAESLRDFKFISTRELSAKKLLQPLTDKKIEVVLDPTLLLDKTEYSKLERKPRNIKPGENYVLCYILGNRDYQEAIEKFAKEKRCKTIYFSDKRDSSYGVEEFLYLIHHAKLICTDSFHACVFSFIFERPFIAFRRTGESDYMYTRLENLIDTFKLKNREFNGKEITKENLKVIYAEAKEILKKEQKKSLNFLKKALDIKE